MLLFHLNAFPHERQTKRLNEITSTSYFQIQIKLLKLKELFISIINHISISSKKKIQVY